MGIRVRPFDAPPDPVASLEFVGVLVRPRPATACWRRTVPTPAPGRNVAIPIRATMKATASTPLTLRE